MTSCRGLGVEPWGDLEDALERPARLPLALVQSRSLECLFCEPSRRRGDRCQLVVEGILAVEEELDGADRPARRPDRHGHYGANDGREHCCAFGEVGLEGRSVVGSDGSTLPKCDREQRRLLEREPATWNLGLFGDSDRVDDEDVVALEQAERSALRAEDLRRTLRESARNLDGGDGSRELAAERLQRLGALERALDLHGGVGRTFPPDPEPACDDDDECPDCEVHRPSGHVFRTSDFELSMRPDEQPERERPTDDERHRGWTDSSQPSGDGEGADERGVHRIAAHQQQTERADEADDRQHEREPVAFASRPRLRPSELFQPAVSHRPT